MQELLLHMQHFFQRPSSNDILSGNSTWSNSIILVEGLKFEREVLKYFSLTSMWVIYEIKILLLRIKNPCIDVTDPVLCVLVYTECYIYNLCFVWYINIYMYYLFVCNRGLFKSYDCYVLFLSFKYVKYSPLKIMKDVFNFISIYLWKKFSCLTNSRSKCVVRKINLYFSDVVKNVQFVLQKFTIFNMI